MKRSKNELEERSEERRAFNSMLEQWYVYIIECRNKELYVGVSKDVAKRVKEHNLGQACRYTQFRWPVKLIYSESSMNYNQARKRERQIKKFSRAKKSALAGQ